VEDHVFRGCLYYRAGNALWKALYLDDVVPDRVYFLVSDDAPAEVKYEDVGSMRRVASAGEMLVQPPDDEGVVKDVLPPPRITNLKVAMVTLNESIVTLTWTAVGDDVSSGKGAYNISIFYNI
jgi:hypothetical protein